MTRTYTHAHTFAFDENKSTVAQMDGIEYACLMRLQIFSGLAFVLGSLAFGFIVVKDSADCLISRQYLCQASGLVMAISLIAFTSFTDYQGYVLFVWIYGFFYGGHCYSIKMFLLEKVRARNLNRAWSFLQASQALPLFVGVPITSKLHACTRTDLVITGIADRRRVT